MQPNKTKSELLNDLLQMRQALEIQGLDEAEKKIYRSTISKIQAQLKNCEEPPPASKGTLHTLRPAASVHSSTPENQAITPQHDPERREMGVIIAIASGQQKRVMIKWKADSVILSEGETRSRFTTALRDLANSRYAQQQRWQDVQLYVTYARACTYYLALMEFWQEAPTPQQLALSSMSAKRQRIFEMIRGDCAGLV